MTYYSTGDASKKLHLSVRTLRYYDQIGLVEPTIKEYNGRRLYSEQDMIKIEKITILKALSLSLDDIKKVLDQITVQDILAVHKRSLENQILELQGSLNHTTTIINSIRVEQQLNWEVLLPLIDEYQHRKSAEQKEMIWKEFFNEKEVDALSNNLPKMGEDDEQTKKWINIIRRVELCLKNSIKPESAEGQLIAEDILLLSKETFHGDEELELKFWEVRKSKEKSKKLGLYPINDDVVNFIEQAIDYILEENYI
ncbi:MerR family transcriptional regulator [Cytobacillus sp. IB215316]|uniref:MerR family transcriptional regulator n=1 Tax=Cytobacillus sp. IB215316 TaxID=3097354 RepID=UPI002A130CCF|nr:MerR family transcriptional regulator [Cytobacillus sp. IB215316]MDX8360597.1 MerR family transcriptional regulator [Cytobacillus sp. IB215316]